MESVAILGGGYAGIRVARRLAESPGREWSITLVDRHDCHQLITRLPHVVSGEIPPEKACVPFGRILDQWVRVLQAEVLSVDPSTLVVDTSEGELRPDWLVLAMGTVPDFMDIPGAAQHALVLKSLEAAMRLRERLEESLAHERVLRVVVIGAGYTGTEIVGELAEWNRRLRAARRQARFEITVASDMACLLPDGNPRLARVAESVLRKKGISFTLGVPVASVESDRVILRSGDELPADLVVWAARSVTPAPLRDGRWQRGRDARILADPYLRAAGYERIYVAGDDALVYDYARDFAVPASAQFATLEGDLVAANLEAEARDRPLREFRRRGLGETLSLGGGDGAAEVAGVVVSGRLAVAAKEAALLRYLASLGNPRIAAEYL